MAVNLSPVGGVAAQFFTNTGAVLTGGKLYTYLAGTTTPATTYTTSAGNVARTNPIILDAAGRVSNSGEIWLTVGISYKFLLKDSNDVLIGTYDNVPSEFYTDASLVTYTPGGAGAVATTVQAKLRESVSVKDFGAVGNGITNDTAAIQAAVAYINTIGGGILLFPSGSYAVLTTPVVSPTDPTPVFSFLNCTGVGIQMEGAQIVDTTVYAAVNNWSTLFGFTNCTNVSLSLKVSTQNWIQDPAYDKRGLNVTQFLGTCSNVTGSLFCRGGIAGVWAYRPTHDAVEASRLFNVSIDAANMEYPILLEDSGNDFTGKLFAQSCGRNFFIHGVKNIDLDVRVLNNQGTSIIGAYNGQGCSEVNINYYDRESTTEYTAPAILMQMLDNVAAKMRNINIAFNIYNLASPAQNPIFGFYAEYAGIGHVIDGLDISGILECGTGGTYSITNLVSIVGGQQMTSADFMRRINFHDLTVTGSGGAGLIDCDLLALKDVANIRNVTTSGGISIYMRNGSAGRVVYENTNGTNFTSSTANTDIHTYINTTQTSPQSQINKLYINANENGKQFNVLNGYVLNVLLLADNGTASLSLPSNVSINSFAFVLGDGGVNAIFATKGTNNATALVSDPYSKFSVAQGTAGKTNIYWDAGAGSYTLENKIGSVQNYQIQFMTRLF